MFRALLLIGAVLLTGCSSSPKNHQVVDAAHSAKLRINHPIYGADNVKIVDGDLCRNDNAFSIDASKSKVARFKKSIDLGIPKTSTASSYYDEFVIPSSKNISIQFSTHKQSGAFIESCMPPGVSFEANVGGLYEAFMSEEYGQCSIQVREINRDGTQTFPVPTQRVKSKHFVGGCKY